MNIFDIFNIEVLFMDLLVIAIFVTIVFLYKSKKRSRLSELEKGMVDNITTEDMMDPKVYSKVITKLKSLKRK